MRGNKVLQSTYLKRNKDHMKVNLWPFFTDDLKEKRTSDDDTEQSRFKISWNTAW